MGKIFVDHIRGALQERLRGCLQFLDWTRLVPAGGNVFIKPNLTYPRYKEGVTTSPAILETLVRCLKDRSDRITIVESDGAYNNWKAEQAFAGHGLYELEKRYGCRLVNLSKAPFEMIEVPDGGRTREIPLPSALLHESDAFISVPVPKIHCMAGMSGSIKNLWGCIPDTMRLRYHYLLPAALVDINRRLRPTLVIGDAQYMLDRNGPMEGDAIPMDLLIGANDFREFDLVACRIMNLDVARIGYLAYAQERGVLAQSLDGMSFNLPIERFATRVFRLKRTARNWALLPAFKNRTLTTLIYDSTLGHWMHRVLYKLVGRPGVA